MTAVTNVSNGWWNAALYALCCCVIIISGLITALVEERRISNNRKRDYLDFLQRAIEADKERKALERFVIAYTGTAYNTGRHDYLVADPLLKSVKGTVTFKHDEIHDLTALVVEVEE